MSERKPKVISPAAMALLTEFSQMLFKEGFLVVGGCIPFKPDGEGFSTDPEHDTGAFGNLGAGNEEQMVPLLMMVAREVSMTLTAEQMGKNFSKKERKQERKNAN